MGGKKEGNEYRESKKREHGILMADKRSVWEGGRGGGETDRT